MKSRYIVGAILGVMCALKADLLPLPNTYQGVLIDECSILRLTHLPFTPEFQATRDWISRNKYGLLPLLRYPNNLTNVEWLELGPKELKNQMGEVVIRENPAFIKLGVEGLGTFNYIFKVPFDERYIIKISGSLYRIANLLAENGIPQNSATDAQINDLDRINTFQTLSIAGVSLRLREFVADNNLSDLLRVPATYLVQLVGGDTADQNALVVQEYIPDKGVSVYDNLAAFAMLSSENLVALARAIVYSGLWYIPGNLFVKDGTLYLFMDMQQPDNEPPSYFFWNDREKYENNIANALANLAENLVAQHTNNRLRQALIDYFVILRPQVEFIKPRIDHWINVLINSMN